MKPKLRPDDAAIDRWVQRSLRERYAAALREAVPEMLTKLLGPEQPGN